MAQTATELLLTQLRGVAIGSVDTILSSSLVLRDSTGPAKASVISGA